LVVRIDAVFFQELRHQYETGGGISGVADIFSIEDISYGVREDILQKYYE